MRLPVCQPALIALAALLGVLAYHDVAEASHTPYLVDDIPNPSVSPALSGVQRAWVIEDDTLSICSDWGDYIYIPAGVQLSVSDWESVLPGTQLTALCGASNSTLWFRRSAVWNWPEQQCEEDWVACAIQILSYDALRDGLYSTGGEIWFNDGYYAIPHGSNNAWRSVAGHELGHFFGLHEYYLEASEQCNSNPPSSVMNAFTVIGGEVIGPCPNGSAVPTQRDIDLVRSFFRPDPPNQWGIWAQTPNTMGIQFLDRAWSESNYVLFRYRLDGNQWVSTGEIGYYSFNVGQKGSWHQAGWGLQAGAPLALYRVCAQAWTDVHGPLGWQCSPSVWLCNPPWHVPPGDPDCDGFPTTTESHVGTNPDDACGFISQSFPSYAWPPDLVGSNTINISDVLALNPWFGYTVPPVPVRYDLVPSNNINISDVLAVKQFNGKSCAP